MRLITPEIVIDKNDPFKNDKLGRKPFAESLMRLVTNIEDNLVISLDGQWGDGKTTFVKMWQGLLEQNEIKTIYFDAFTNDYFDDPFVALVGNITSLLEKAHANNEKLKELKAKASKVGVQLLSLGARVGIKAATLGIIKDSDIESIKNIAEDIASSTSNFASKIIEEKLNSYKGDLDAIKEFREKLSELAQEVFDKKQKPLIFIVDELDRCKPTYAVSLMEKIKHLFSVEHIVFVLVMNMQQMEETIKCLYGQGIKSRTYLQKFINIECNLPKKCENIYDDDYKQYCRFLRRAHGLETSHENLPNLFEILARRMKLSLRDLQRCHTYLALFYSTKKWYMDSSLVDFLVILKVKQPDLFDSIKTEKMNFEELWTRLKYDRLLTKREEIRILNKLKRSLRICLLPEEEFKKLDDGSDEKQIWSRIEFNYDKEREEILPYHCDQIESFKFLENEK